MKPSKVPAGPLAVDTGVFSWLHEKRGRYNDFAPLVAGHPLALPFPVVGELKVGAIRAKLGSRRLDSLNAAIVTCVVIPTDARIVDKWAELHARFLGRLTGGGINDLWTAACCLVHGLPIATADLGDFQQMASEFPDLRLVHPDL
ncbi:MAG: PIN domain-containing protein [Solirubrobacteraceae bacterium]